VRRVRQALAGRLERRPAGVRLARVLVPARELVPDGTEACIAGFPRSANTLAYFAFRRANPGVRVLHHVHEPGPVLACAELGVPCAVLVREPVEAVASFVVFRGGATTASRALARYVRFHAAVERVRERIAVCEFEAVLADPALVARELNRVFGTAFEATPLDEPARAEVRTEIERTQAEQGRAASAFAVPTPEKEALKPRARQAVESDPRLSAARRIHARLAGR
jgi:hypothetical protein